MRRFATLLLAAFFISSLGTADTLYKWVDAQGNVHYSDKPAPGATKINVPKAPTFTPPKVAMPPATNAGGNTQQTVAGYSALTISSPQDQETLWNTTSVTVSVSPTPALHPGDTVTMAVDGVSQTVSAASAVFDNLDRGQHTATASIAGAGGQVSAKAVTFYIQRATQKKPP